MVDDQLRGSDDGRTDPADGWPMGAVARRTGISEHTLRAWERRFGFPAPERLPSGHRRYSTDQVRQLILVARALGHGCRAGDVVPLSMDRLKALVRECEDRGRQAPELASRQWVEEVFDAAMAFHGPRIGLLLRAEAMRLGLPRFLRERLTGLLHEVGDAWAREDLAIRHEHLISEQVEDFLRSERARLDGRLAGAPVLLTTLPGEPHGLGLQLAALEVALAGRAVRVLGSQLPVAEISGAAVSAGAVVVALSVSIYADPERTEERIRDLREALPDGVELWVGGGGAVSLELGDGVEVIATLDALAGAVVELQALGDEVGEA